MHQKRVLFVLHDFNFMNWNKFHKDPKAGFLKSFPEGRSAATLIKFTSLWFSNDLEDSGVFD